MLFSERYGYKPVRQQLQFELVDEGLRNLLWSVYIETFFSKLNNYDQELNLTIYAIDCWLVYLKQPIDTLITTNDRLVDKETFKIKLRNYFFNEHRVWYDYYDFIGFAANYAPKNYTLSVNRLLEREKIGYRFINNEITRITSETEVSAIEEAIGSTDKYKSVNTHLNTALKLLSDKQNPDYRNSIKESISSVESICKIFTGNDKATLGATLSQLEKENKLHSALKKSLSNLYGYTSDGNGIRHGLMEGDNSIDFHEAKFMLVTCSAFVNYLIGLQSNS